jgi:hypothetical protein
VQLFQQPHPVLDIQADGCQVLEEGATVDQLDGGAHSLGGGERLGHQVVLDVAQPAGDAGSLRFGGAPGIQAEGEEQLLGQGRLVRLGDGVDSEEEAVDAVLHRDLVLLGLDLHVGGSLARA